MEYTAEESNSIFDNMNDNFEVICDCEKDYCMTYNTTNIIVVRGSTKTYCYKAKCLLKHCDKIGKYTDPNTGQNLSKRNMKQLGNYRKIMEK